MGDIECRSPNEKISQGVAALLYRQAECDTFGSRMIFRRFQIFDDFLWAQAVPFVKWNQCHLDMTSSAQTRKQHTSKTTSFADGSHHLTTQQFPKGARHASCSCLRKVFAGQSLPRESLALLQVLLLSWIKPEHGLRMVPKQCSSVYTRVSQIGQHLQKLKKCKLVRCCYQDA